MHLTSDDLFNLVQREIESDELCKRFTQSGMCRSWSGAALKVLDTLRGKLESQIEYEAREVNISIGLSHTFIKIVFIIEDEAYAYLMDGCGVLGFEPYFGREGNAPKHLLGSHSDPINLYRKLDRSGNEK